MGYLMSVTVELIGGVAVIRVDQPLGAVLAGVRAALPGLVGVEAVVLHGCARALSSDVTGPLRAAPAERAERVRQLHALRAELAALPVPVVAAIGGNAFGDVARVVMACDRRVLAEGGGIVSVSGDGVVVVRRVAAAEALRTGLVDRVVEPGAVLAAAVELAHQCGSVRPGRR